MLAFAETVNLDKDEVNLEELWSWVQNVYKDCPFDSSERLCINATDIANKEESDKIQRIKDHYDTPAGGYAGHTITLKLLKRNHK